MDRQERRYGAHPDRRGHEAHSSAGFARAAGPKMTERSSQRRHRPRRTLTIFVSAVFAIAAFTVVTAGQMTSAPASAYRRDPGIPASVVPAPLREVGFDQHLNEAIPLDIPFVDESGRAVRLGDYFGARPVVLALVYYDCPMLCTQVLNSLTSTLKLLSLDPGRDFDVVIVSFDPREKPALAAAKKAAHLDRYKRPGAAGG